MSRAASVNFSMYVGTSFLFDISIIRFLGNDFKSIFLTLNRINRIESETVVLFS